jgi:hypothetical protein
MAEGDAKHGYLSVLYHAGRLPGLRQLGFQPLDLDEAVDKIIVTSPFTRDGTRPEVDTHDRLRAWHIVNTDDDLRGQLPKPTHDSLLATALRKEHQVLLAEDPHHFQPLPYLEEHDITAEPIDEAAMGEAREWHDRFLDSSPGQLADHLALFSETLAVLDGGGEWLADTVAEDPMRLMTTAQFHTCDINAIATSIECTDPAIIVDSGPPATRINTSFVTDNATPDRFVDSANPLCWPRCEDFFREMTPMGLMKPLWNPADEYQGEEGILYEVVDFLYPYLSYTMETYLRMMHFKDPVPQGQPLQTAANLDTVGMTFRFVGSADGEIDVDHGFLLAQWANGDRTSGKTAVSSQKTVRFRKLPNVFARLACELGWANQMRKMGCCDNC